MHGDEFIVAALVVAHTHDADGSGPHQHTRGHGFLTENEDVQGIAIVPVSGHLTFIPKVGPKVLWSFDREDEF